jgi:CheY-like chemotaxis protein
MKALVVDDSAILRKVIIKTLNELGIQDITEADSGLAAIDLWPTARFDLMLIDRNMPGLDGAASVQRLRALPDGERAKILMVSSDATVDRIKDAMAAGCNGFLPKPFSQVQLKRQLERLLGRE